MHGEGEIAVVHTIVEEMNRYQYSKIGGRWQGEDVIFALNRLSLATLPLELELPLNRSTPAATATMPG